MSVDDLKHDLSLTLSKQHVAYLRYWLTQVKSVDQMINLKKDDEKNQVNRSSKMPKMPHKKLKNYVYDYWH